LIAGRDLTATRAAARRRWLAFGAAGALGLSALVAARSARADKPSSTPDPAVVELYQEARALVKEGRWDEACPKFEAAMLKQPTASILINVGDCHAHQGKLTKAMEDYDVARELNLLTQDETRRAALASEIETRVKQLAKRVPMLRIIVENAVTDMVIRIDGNSLDEDKIGVDVPVEPGAHAVTAEATGFEAAPQQLTLKEGARERVTLRFVPRSFASQHRASISLAAGAVALAGAGAALGGWTMSTHGSLSELCKGGTPAECAGARSDLQTGAIATNVALATAGAVAGAAIVVFVVAERPKAPKVQASISGTFATVSVTW
jgi:hypothetical protein